MSISITALILKWGPHVLFSSQSVLILVYLVQATLEESTKAGLHWEEGVVFKDKHRTDL